MSRTYETRYAERHRKAGKGYSGASVIFILLCCALTVFLLSTSYLGDKLVDQYITPTFAKIMGKATPEPSQLPVMAPVLSTVTEPPVAEKIVFELPEASWYLLQMGAYADPEEAHAQALSIQSMGAGGYIYEDEQGFSRVFAAVKEMDELAKAKDLLKKAGYSASDITDFASLKKVADDIQARRSELGVKGAFVSSGLGSDSSWRFTNHLANMPLWYEFKDANETNPDSIKGTYLENYKNIFDLYINDGTVDDHSKLSDKKADDAVNEFLNGEAVFYQNGTWGYKDIKALGDDKIGLLPIYIGVDGEKDQGVCAGTENYWCVNANASEDDQKATLDFIYWVVTSDEGTKALAEDMGFSCPFKSAKETDNAIAKEAKAITDAGKTRVGWAFSVQPNQEYRDDLASALNKYAAGGSWDEVKTAFVDNWATEKKANA